ncbi:protein IQ-DOMAIN 19-like [Typha latifolia]|uniref:protein IQ-DOMAIN 19-like n=1 Tax=Typha latifolia TaxID=4733 RepID=UPI003C2F9A9F
MGKTAKWLKSFLTGKKEKEKEKEKRNCENQPCPLPAEKRRWSFRRSAVEGKDQRSHAMTVAKATRRNIAAEDVAAVRIQSIFRAYLAKKALYALRGFVKLQALIRGQLVRKQATTTLRRMRALMFLQAKASSQRMQMLEEERNNLQRQSIRRIRSLHYPHLHQSSMEGKAEDNVKIVEIDNGYNRGSSKSRYSYLTAQVKSTHHSLSEYCNGSYSKVVVSQQLSPTPSALTDMSPRIFSNRLEELSFATAQSSPYFSSASYVCIPISRNNYAFSPNYMADTESSRAKARSQSAPKMRPESCERPLNRRRASMEWPNIPRAAAQMQRSSLRIGSPA